MHPMQGKFSHAVLKAMEEQDVSIRDLAEVTESTYEHVRKVVRGLSFPSKHMLRILANKLKLNVSEMEKFVTEDRIKARYGSVASVVAGKNPKLDPFEVLLPYLTDRDLEELLSIAQMKAKMNQVAAEPAAPAKSKSRSRSGD